MLCLATAVSPLVCVDGLPAQPYAVGDSVIKDIAVICVSAFEAFVRCGQTVEKLPLPGVSFVANYTAPVAGVVPLMPVPFIPLTILR